MRTSYATTPKERGAGGRETGMSNASEKVEWREELPRKVYRRSDAEEMASTE